MPYQDTSPAGQHFMNFSRPLSLAVVARAADDLTFELIYGFGEYRFHADPARHDSLADLARLADALEAGFDYVEATFADAGGHTRLILQGDAGRLAFARSVRSLLND